MTDKLYVSAQSLLTDSFMLAKDIMESGYRPNFIVAIWRGGTPIGMAVQEFLLYNNIKTDHIAIKTSAYGHGIDNIKPKITVDGLSYVVKKCNSDDKLLIIDDVYDTGLSVNEVIKNIKAKCRKNAPEIKVATIYFKPHKNKTTMQPDFFIHKTDNWIVFPHELEGLTKEEIIHGKGNEIGRFFD
jgi:uncharacterized protein